MLRFVTFVDGSNLDGVLKHLNLRVDDYGSFYRHVFEQSVQYWGRTFADGCPWPSAQHSRIYWYVVGKMDEWDLNDPKAEARLRQDRFELNPRLRDSYLEDISSPPSRTPPRPPRNEEAWNLCFARDPRVVREQAAGGSERKKRFYHGVQAATDFVVEIRQEGHWKVDLLHHTLNEKGLDTSLAVDMVAAPGHVRHRHPDLGRRRRHRDQLRQGAARSTSGSPSSRRGATRPTSRPKGPRRPHLKIAADFVVQVYEADLIRRNLAYRAEPDYPSGISYSPSIMPHEGNY